VTAEGSPACLWCGRPFKPRHGGGSRQIFCRAGCRNHFHRVARQWAEGALAAGILTVGDLQGGPGAAYTLARKGKSPGRVPEEGKAGDLLHELLDELLDDALPAELLAALSEGLLDRISAYLDGPPS